MTNAEIIQAIRNEIERLKSKYRHNGLWTSSFQSDLAMAKIESMNELLSFLSTLEKAENEQPICEEQEEPKYYQHFDQDC